MMKKIVLLITTIAILLVSSACSYFLPREEEVVTPELRDSEAVVMPSIKIRRGDLVFFHDINANFVPEPTEKFTGELNKSGEVSNIYFFIGEEVKKGDLVLELDTESIKDKIMVQEINLEKTRLAHEQNIVLYETGKADKYTVEFSKLSLASAENYLSDLKEDLAEHYVYSPADGVVVSLNYDVGDKAFGPVFTVSKLSLGVAEILMNANADARSPAEMATLDLDIGDKVIIIYEGKEYNAELLRDVTTYYTEVEYDAQNLHFNFSLEEVPEGISFNKIITMRNIIEEARNAIVVPLSSVYAPETNPYTYVLVNGEIEKRSIELGMDDGYFYEVTSGLKEGEMILKIN